MLWFQVSENLDYISFFLFFCERAEARLSSLENQTFHDRLHLTLLKRATKVEPRATKTQTCCRKTARKTITNIQAMKKKKSVVNMPEITNAQMDLNVYLSIKKNKKQICNMTFQTIPWWLSFLECRLTHHLTACLRSPWNRQGNEIWGKSCSETGHWSKW